ncbi:nucleotidyltransferase domain-containing protein [Candidatus Woesearchaeota archaeon]|nr:nucleotidyltransferase domain-containing protein [Candidatus Woesearchaeota archaeon]
MYNKINITENGLQIISLFTNGFDREYYIREVEKLLKISPRTAQLILEDLEKKGIIESKVKGKIKSYKLNINEVSNRYLTLVEQYKSIAFMEKHLLVKEVITKISQVINGIGIIFGSYAKGIAHEESDLDILVVGDYDKEEIKRVSRNLGIEISVKCYPLKIFEKNLNRDIFLKEVLKNHIVFKNTELFIQTVRAYG